MTPRSHDAATGRTFENNLVKAIATAAPRAAIVRNWQADSRRAVDVVVGFATTVFVVEAKAWDGTIAVEAGTLRIQRARGIYRVPDPRPGLARLLRPLREVRNRFAHAVSGGGAAPEPLLLNVVVVVPDGTALPAGDHGTGIELLTAGELCERLRQSQEEGISETDLRAKLGRIVAEHSRTADRAPSSAACRGMPALGGALVGREDLVNSLARASQRGKWVILTGGRRQGKTSVLYAVRRLLERSNRMVAWADVLANGHALSNTFGQLQRGSVVLVDDADVAKFGCDDGQASAVRDAIERSGAAVVATTTRGTMPWFFAGAGRDFRHRWTVYPLRPFSSEDVRPYFSALPKRSADRAVSIASQQLGGHPFLCAMFFEFLRNCRADDDGGVSAALDRVSAFLEHGGLGCVSREMADLLVRSGFKTNHLPMSLRSQAEALASTGWFTLDGWVLKPVAPAVAEAVAASLNGRSGGESEPCRLELADRGDSWQPFLEAVRAAWTQEGMLDLFDVKTEDRPDDPAHYDPRPHLAGTLGLQSVEEVLTTWFGHRDRRRLANHLGLDIDDIPSNELTRRILDTLLRIDPDRAMP